MEIDDITPVAQDYVKAIWNATEWGEPPITTKALAARFETSAPNVSETLRRLARQGLVAYAPYKPVVLTDAGRRLALVMVRRHRLLETFLVNTLGYTWDEVHDDAERLEHAVSPLLMARIDDLLGHPEADPHGDPIPRADLTVPHPADVGRLDEAAPGAYLVVRINDDHTEVLQRLTDLRVRPGSTVRIAANGAALTEDGEALGESALSSIHARPLHGSPEDVSD
ncbi:metal-dependent transcriptional regulator [Galactobacter caseinivorans]|uniref:Manganese transport regulator n=1 Tax=Galactobacter caseinivorans TaxID=2676123 RepID=A0A496PJ98_9MICC|nr:metal-dependent transcriptional regulator [Galactobacter caseinivorans]RKW70571.1 metal-dependent transcriptional regulator [Galactobacter caseinivorans]